MKIKKSSSVSSPDIKKNPLVSVIIPAWNRAHMIRTALDSVFSQDYPNVEVIVVDDGSTDSLRKAMKNYPRVILFPLKKHEGQCTSRNYGLDRAAGEYIQFLDSDDALSPGAISRHVAYLEAHPEVDLVYGDLVSTTSHALENPHVKNNPKFKPDIRKGTPIDFDMKKVLLQNLKHSYDPKDTILTLFVPTKDYFRISTGTALFRKTPVRYDPVIEKNWDCSADVDFWGQLIMSGFKFAYLPGNALECRMHTDNITNRAGLHTKKRIGVRRYIYNKLLLQASNDK